MQQLIKSTVSFYDIFKDYQVYDFKGSEKKGEVL